MVKGVNKSIIEINDTGNKFFNKVILFVSPDYTEKSQKQLTNEADLFIKKLQTTSRESLRRAVIRERKKRRRILIFSAIAITAAIITALVLIL